MAKRKSIPEKLKRILQQEINSLCPMTACNNGDIDHFQIHHINEDPSNNDLSNLIMLCPTCHSKITKGDITLEEVKIIKNNLFIVHSQVEFVSVVVDTKKSNWELKNQERLAFYDSDDSSPLVLNWSFINHSNKTLILKQLKYKAHAMYRGLSGIPESSIVKVLTDYEIKLTFNDELHTLDLTPQLQIPSGAACSFNTEFSTYYNNEKFDLRGRKYLDISFVFSNNIEVFIPKIFLNCDSENEGMILQILN